MRIGVSGPGGTGKSTLVAALSVTLGIPFVGEGVNEWLAARGLPGPWSLSSTDQLRLQRHAIASKCELEIGPSFLSDRTTIDALSLLTLRLERHGIAVPKDLRDAALDHARTTYDVALILGPTRVTDEIDTVALLDDRLRVREVELTLGGYHESRIPSIRVPALPPAETERFALDAVRIIVGGGR